jgi:hypothetical protein
MTSLMAVVVGGAVAVHAEELSTSGSRTVAGSTSASRTPVRSGLVKGAYIPTFYSRAVTGPLMNKSVCYVCRNGQRPVVMLLMRRMTPAMRPLLKNIDRIVDGKRAYGLRTFGVLISEEPSDALPIVQTFAFNGKITMPLTVATEAVSAPSCQNVHGDAALTIVLYHKRRAVSSIALRADELDKQHIRDALKSVQNFANNVRW